MSSVTVVLPRNVVQYLVTCLPNRIDRDRDDAKHNRTKAAEFSKGGDTSMAAIASACAFEFSADAEAYHALLMMLQDAIREGGSK